MRAPFRYFCFFLSLLLLFSCNKSTPTTNYKYTKISIGMSSTAKDYISLAGGDLGYTELRESEFEREGGKRDKIMAQDPTLPFPAEPDGTPIQLENNLVESKYGTNRVYSIIPDNAYDCIVLYIHGGAYVYDFLSAHFHTCDLLATKLNAKIVIPQYFLAFNHIYADAYSLLDSVYDDLLKEGKKIMIFGDSAGGGLTLAFTEYLRNNSRELPEGLVMFSPWIDITTSNPDISQYEARDISLAAYGIIECGKMWAGGTDRTDYRLSPLYGNLDGLPDVLLFVGDAEILYPDCNLLANHLKDRTNVTFVIGKDLFHAFPVYYFLPEAKQSYEIISDFVKHIVFNGLNEETPSN